MSYTEVKTDQATFRILHRLEGKPVLKADLPRSFEALLVEMVHQDPIKDPEKRVAAYVGGLSQIPDLALPVERVKKNKARVYFGDLAENQLISSNRDLNLMLVEFLAGLVIISAGLKSFLGKLNGSNNHKDSQDDKKAKRKKNNFFLPLGLILLGFWLLSSVFEILGFFLVNVAGSTTKKGFLKAVQQTVREATTWHPEKTVVFLRNLLFAEKAWEVAELESGSLLQGGRRSLLQGGRAKRGGTSGSLEVRSASKNSPPLIVIDVHFGHAGIEKMLSWTPQVRQIFLQAYRPFLKKILNDPIQKDYLARLISVSWQKDHWQVERNYLVDSLEDL
ncbi:hypothetical protein ACFLZP_03430 [Patescibacteria group bacterium]